VNHCKKVDEGKEEEGGYGEMKEQSQCRLGNKKNEAGKERSLWRTGGEKRKLLCRVTIFSYETKTEKFGADEGKKQG